MKKRTLTAIIILAIVIPPILLGGITFYIFIGAGISIAMYEIFRVTQQPAEINEKGLITKPEIRGCKDWPAIYKMFLVLLVLISTFYPFIQNFIFQGQFTYPTYPNNFDAFPVLYVPAMVMFAIIFTLFAGSIFSEKIHINNVVFVGFMTIFLSLAGQAAIVCRETGNNVNCFIYVVLVCILTDTFAYFSGYLFGRHGRHKLNPRISPKKTWEGAIGGTLLGALIPFAITFVLPLVPKGFGADEWFKLLDTWWIVLIISFVLSISAQFGDFTFSAIKRFYGIKDFGSIFPGHGGVLDRMDSILYNMIVFAIILTTLRSGHTVL